MYQLSVIVPVFQAENYIDRTLSNIVTLPSGIREKVEILLVDDGSTDGSKEKCVSYEKNYDTVRLITKENGGVSSARNTGICYAKGEYILFLDSDDNLSDGLIEKLLDIIENIKPELIIFGFQYVYIDGTFDAVSMKCESKMYQLKTIQDEFYNWYSSRILHNIGTKVYKKEILDKYSLLFSDGQNYLEDISFCLQYMKRIGRFFYLEEIGYLYYTGINNSLSDTAKKGYIKDLKIMMGMIEEIADTNTYNKIFMEEIFILICNDIKDNRNWKDTITEISRDKKSLNIFKDSKKQITLKSRLILQIAFTDNNFVRNVLFGILRFIYKRKQ